MLTLSSLSRWGNWGPEQISCLPTVSTQMWAVWPGVCLTDFVKSLLIVEQTDVSVRQHKSFKEFCSHTFCDQASKVVQWERICLPMQKTRDTGLISGVGWTPGVGNGNPLQVFLPGEFHRQRGLAGYSPWGHKELNITERMHTHTHTHTHTQFCDETSQFYFIYFINTDILITLRYKCTRKCGIEHVGKVNKLGNWCY